MPIQTSKNAPVPSQADYSPCNVVPLMRFFAPIVNALVGRAFDEGFENGITAENLMFRYENNTPNKASDDIFVEHPNRTGDVCNETPLPSRKSRELREYEEAAKKSKRLLDFMRKSPANIEYFK